MALPASASGTPVVPGRRWWVHRSSWVAGAALLVVAAAAWMGVVREASSMSSADDMEDGATGIGASLELGEAAAYIGSWGVMMIAMMLPSAVPMIALYSTVRPSMAARYGGRTVSTSVFGALYVLVWMSTGILAYAGSVLASAAAHASDDVSELAPYAVATVLVAAGAYQFSPVKRTCLRRCRGPLAFLASQWRPGVSGAIRLGLAHSGYCIGCCWALMVVLVAAGAMGMMWVLLIAALVFVEKVLPYGEHTARTIGVALALLGLLVAAEPDLASTLHA
ncbi:DUF2182 domain-containing protein [Phytoactinopolyspora endophytica]|uniref:DUF2182 domain-containing protein n=1 Tax=Phytoactinopolyspora endophytica TaxID=1642495 RepID=UPI00101DA1CB|nr:DUF2182 domain-containing protein [Phytoactinopolyspora endophytica]